MPFKHKYKNLPDLGYEDNKTSVGLNLNLEAAWRDLGVLTPINTIPS